MPKNEKLIQLRVNKMIWNACGSVHFKKQITIDKAFFGFDSLEDALSSYRV